MTDLRQAAQRALEALREFGYHGSSPRWERTANALKAALEQPEQEPTPWREMVVVTLVREGINKHKARELADHFAAQRPWQGLTDDDWEEIDDKKDTALDSFAQGAVWAADQLKERNKCLG